MLVSSHFLAQAISSILKQENVLFECKKFKWQILGQVHTLRSGYIDIGLF